MFIVCLNIGDNQANQSPQLERWDRGTVGLSGWHHVSNPPPSTTPNLHSLLFLPPLPLSCPLLGSRADSIIRICPEVCGHIWKKVKETRGETVNLVHSIICSVAVLSYSWEILNTLYDNESAGDRHKYWRQSAEGLKCLVRLLITQICHWFHGLLNRSKQNYHPFIRRISFLFFPLLHVCPWWEILKPCTY